MVFISLQGAGRTEKKLIFPANVLSESEHEDALLEELQQEQDVQDIKDVKSLAVIPYDAWRRAEMGG